MDRQELSRTDFASAVRDHMNEELADHGHHPGREYTPLAFRHYIRRLAVLEALEGVSFRTALDVGCAEGFFMAAIRDRFGAEVWGVDISDAAVEKVVNDMHLSAAAADATRLPFADGSFDLVLSTEVIEHVLDPEVMLSELRRVSRGTVLITTPVSQTAHEHEPDYELAQEGHVNNFDPATVRRIFGPDADLGSFRCNASLVPLMLVGRHMPPPVRDWFYAFDHATAKHLGAPDHQLKPLRNRDWLIKVPGLGKGEGRPEWRCPSCRAQLIEEDGSLRCTGCSARYSIGRGVPDFFAADEASPPAP